MHKDYYDRIVIIVASESDDAKQRKSLVEQALHNCAVLQLIDWEGSAVSFAFNLVKRLQRYGYCHSSNQPALVMLLEEIKKYKGINHHREIDDLIKEVFNTTKYQAPDITYTSPEELNEPLVQIDTPVVATTHVIEAEILSESLPKQQSREIQVLSNEKPSYSSLGSAYPIGRFAILGLDVFIPMIIALSTYDFFPTLDNQYIVLAVISHIIALLVISTLIYQKTSGLRRVTQMSATYFLSTMFIWLIFFLIIVLGEQPTWYFIVDVTQQTQGVFSTQVTPFSNLRLNTLTREVDFVGLSVFGGNGELSGVSGCEDLTELVPAGEKANNLPLIRQYLNDLSLSDTSGLIPPGGVGSIQMAVANAIKQLQNRRGIQGIVIITVGLQNGCDTASSLNRDMINDLAYQNNVNLELVIIVPDCNKVALEDQETLRIFSQGHFSCPQPDEYDTTIQEILNTSPSSYRQSYYQQ
jgi:hypothetical protein